MKKSMRKIFSVIIVLAMVIGLFPMGTVEAKANENTQGNVSYEPLQLSKDVLEKTGGNAIGTATDYETAQLKPDSFFFYDKSFSDSKGASTFDGPMPEGGKIKVGEVDYQLADYEGKDCILLNRLDMENSSNTATLVLETIGVYDKVYVLATAGGVGASTSAEFSVTLTYTEGEDETTTYYLRDWFASGLDSNSIYTNIKRAHIAEIVDGKNSKVDASDEGSLTAGPLLQSSPIEVDESRLLKSITFTYEDKNDSLFCAVFGVTGVTPPGVPDAPTAKAASPGSDASTVFVANWEAPVNQGLSDVDNYCIDIARDKNFTDILDDYNNKPVGNVTSYNVTSTANSVLDPNATYYYRVRAKNAQGQSISSNRVATALPEWLGAAMDTADHSKVTFDLDTNTATFDDSVVLIDTIKVPNGEKISICVPEGKTVTGAENKPAINAVSGTGETVSLNVYGGGTIQGGKGSDEDVTAETPAQPGQPAIDFSQAKGTATLVVGKTTNDTTKIIGGNGGTSTTATGGDGGAGIYLSGTSTMQKNGTPNIQGGAGGTGVNENSKGKAGIPVLSEFSASAITATAYSGMYDGREHGIFVTYPQGATITYSREENGNYTNEYPTETNVTDGDVTIYYKVEKDGYVSVKGSSTITITRKPVSEVYVSFVSSNIGYTGEMKEVQIAYIHADDRYLLENQDYVISGQKTGTDIGTYYLDIEGKGNYSGTTRVYWRISDLTAPAGEIKINENNKWSAFIDSNSIIFNLFYPVEQTITITASDFGSGLAEQNAIQYYVSSSAMSLYNLQNMSYYNWSTYSAPVKIQPTRNCIVYAKITDKAGNVTYISSNGIVLDNQAPVFNGISDEMISDADSVEFTVSDLSPVEVYIDGVKVTPVNGKYTITELLRNQVVKAVDKCGNTTTITVLVHGDNEAPTGVISIDEEHSWSTLLEEHVGVFYNEAQKITIEAADAGMGLAKTEYIISEEELCESELEEITDWETYTKPVTVNPDKVFAVYVKLTDNVGNVSYLSSDAIILDATAPVISGIVNGKVYCSDEVKFTVDDEYLKEVRINGEVVQAEFEEESEESDSEVELVAEEDEKGFYTVTVGDDVQVIEVVDMSGNVTKYEITVNGCHTWKEPVVTWGKDDLSAKLDFVCKYDETHTYSEEVQATLEIEDGATGSQKGKVTHVVSVKLDGKTYTVKKVNDTPVVEEEKIGDGKLTAKVEVAEDVPEVVVDDLDVDLVKDLLTEEQLESVEADGSQIEVSLKIETLKDAAPEADVKLVKDTLATIVKDLTVKNDYVSTEEVKSGIEYIDLSLYMKIDDNPEEKISQLKGKELTITMEIPENIKSDKKGRQYYVIRVHDGSEVEVLDSVIDLVAGTIQFKTDRFSTYAIVYTDVTDAEVNVPEIPKTADSSDVELFVLTLAAGVYMVVCAGKKRKEV